MKKALIVLMILGIGLGTLVAQSKSDISKEINEMKVELEKNLSDIPGSPKMTMTIRKNFSTDSDAPDAAYFGIFSEDLDFPKAQELGYKGCYGVLITGVVSGSPAWDQRLQENDIILSMDAKEVSNFATFERLRKQYRAGDTVAMELFRMGEVIKMDFTFGSRETKTAEAPGEEPVKQKKKSVGYGGGTWIPMWFDTDMTDINHIVTSMGFSKLNEDGILMQGGGGKGYIGKGFFIGGQVTGYKDNKKIQEPVASGAPASGYHIWMQYKSTMGGVTLDKRFALTKGIITSAGLMLGGGSHTIEILKSNSNYDWTDWDNTVLNSQNTHTVASRSYIVVQPRAELMLRLLPWMGIRAEAGYTYGYAPKEGWRVKGLNKDNFEVLHSPNTEYQGLNVTIGPWFGF
ncbi:MAG: hypothetical protein CVU50_01030 [Candidatus Cloacimonetes bacterium HGW-Cloacimonetes-3]|nr:MAG: hypothetical protein CVU50_01030 [Candidatus Cloacimonetes bacterium HGW-Cloacimonetes-3]